MLTRLVQTKQALVVILILTINTLLFFKYAWNGAGKEPTSLLEVRQSRQVEGAELHVDDSVYPATEGVGGHTPPVIIYNRVPKTGSTTFANIAYSLTGRNRFHMLHINVTYKNSHYLHILDQQRFVKNISLWVDKQPALYHGHLYYLDFTRFGHSNPIYINIVRDPIERLISYYYFLRYGDDYRPHLKRASAKDTRTLDQCLVTKGKDCDLARVLWIQIPFFCGQAAQCLVPSRWALEQAKTNLVNHFLLVGVTEQLGEFIALLETMLPQYFSGAYELYTNGGLGHLRKTKEKKTPSDSSLTLIRQSEIYQLEQEFYEFAKQQFDFLKQRALKIDDQGRAIISPPEFKYEKIYPLPKHSRRYEPN